MTKNKILLVLPVSANSPSFLKDGSTKMSYTTTRETTDDEKMILVSQFQKLGWLVFSANKIDDKDIPNEAVLTSGKSPSQKVRNKIYVLWDKKNRPGDFEFFYRQYMEKLLDVIGNQIHEAENG